MTITEKILAAHADRKEVRPGELIEARVDMVMCHDVTTPPAVAMLEERGMDRVFDPERIVVTPDHFVPNKDIRSAELAKRLREWVRRHGIKHYYEVGRHGICHALLPEEGFVRPGMVVVGADSHTCTYGALGAFSTGIGSTDLAAVLYSGRLWFRVPESMKVVLTGELPKGVYSKDVILEVIRRVGVDGARYMAMEFTGPLVETLSVDARLTMTNMAIEAGAKNGIIAPDEKVLCYVRARTDEPFQVYTSDPDAEYARAVEVDVSSLEPLVAFPHLPSNGKPISEVGEVHIDQVVIGSCTNGRLEDLRVAARILKGRKVAPYVRAIVIPATSRVWHSALKEGLLDIFIEAGCAVSTPTCGPCLGGHMGVLAEGERCASTTNRNFVGRMGHPKSEVYLVSPATAAASAVKGKIADPREFL
ncbi:MAG: 3-isopropylmalate dehydratase large subunit [Candidatus Latescibacterota bacterium]|nr:MAG: 3-isopropylmalate dehydratase large subunit [Candidatus Latescibacterota bacterium]